MEPDRVPVDLGGHRSSGIAAIAYHNLRKYLRLPEKPVRVYDMVQQLAIIDEDVLNMFAVDTIEMGRGFLLNDEDWKPWILPDGTECEIPYYINVEKKDNDWLMFNDEGCELGILKKESLYFEQTYFPLLERGIENDDFSDLQEMLGKNMWSVMAHPGAHLALDEPGLKELTVRAKALRASTDRAIVGLFGGNIFELPQFLYRMDNYLLSTGLYPDKVLQLSEELSNIHLSNLDKWLSAVGPYTDIIMFGDDFGGQQGPLISPDAYRTLYKPFHKKIWNRARELADIKVQLHCCGGIYELLPDLIDAGLDAINPVQISCRGMDPARLKAEFGDRITFWGGGCDTAAILPRGSTEDVKKCVKRRIDDFAPGGGFVFTQVHNIQPDVPAANVMSMIEAFDKFRGYSKSVKV
ncbi:MAG: methyltransferase, partial [Bacteroidales bacterium]|nr:methyltransferase [Bacteroidales bacterium]